MTLLPAIVTLLGTGLAAVPASFSSCPAVLLSVARLPSLRTLLALTALTALATLARTRDANVHGGRRLLSTDDGSGDGQDLLTEINPSAEHVHSRASVYR